MPAGNIIRKDALTEGLVAVLCVQEDNAFTELEDPEQGQALADRFPQLRSIQQLSRWARRVNPHLRGSGWLAGMTYHGGLGRPRGPGASFRYDDRRARKAGGASNCDTVKTG